MKEIVEENGLTGYQGITGSSTGTIIMNESAGRRITGLAKGYHAILAGRSDASIPIGGFTQFDIAAFNPHMVKNDAADKTKKLDLSLILSMISAVAIASSAMLMRQVLMMIAEARWELYGILRAIGLSQRHIRSMFTAEALLLSLLSAGAGTLLGTIGGYLLVHEFYSRHSVEFAKMSGHKSDCNSAYNGRIGAAYFWVSDTVPGCDFLIRSWKSRTHADYRCAERCPSWQTIVVKEEEGFLYNREHKLGSCTCRTFSGSVYRKNELKQ